MTPLCFRGKFFLQSCSAQVTQTTGFGHVCFVRPLFMCFSISFGQNLLFLALFELYVLLSHPRLAFLVSFGDVWS